MELIASAFCEFNIYLSLVIHATVLREILIFGDGMKAEHQFRRGFESVGDEKACYTSFSSENQRLKY